jgi:peptide/nickel transport system substrate-binding protein
MKRRTFLAATAALATAPAITRAASATTLKFVPQSDVTVIDPIWTTAYVTRNHGFMIFDTLYGIDGNFKTQPQMVEGHRTESDGKQWDLMLRDGLAWHDGEKVLARDCVASIKRWGTRDSFGQTLMAYTDEISAPDDKTIRFRLKKPFALLPDALGKPGSNFCAMMPERLANTDAFTQVTEMVGSGPFKWNAKDRVVGSLAVYDRNAAYKPRSGPLSSWTAGPKIAHFDRVEWHVIPDESTKANAMTTGEVDWWENPTADMMALLSRSPNIDTRITDQTGTMSCLRFNQLWAPFNNPAIRRAVLHAVNQIEFMTAGIGTDTKLWKAPVGTFCPQLPMGVAEGLSTFTGNADFARLSADIRQAGYAGEKVVLMAPTDQAISKAECDVAADMFKQLGMNVDYQAMDWGTLVQRRAQDRSPAEGGWSMFITGWTGLDQANPIGHVFLRGNGRKAMFGWPDAPKLEVLRQQWIDAQSLEEQKTLAVALQRQAFEDVPYVPLGQYFSPTAFHKDITGILDGFPIFWNVRRA